MLETVLLMCPDCKRKNYATAKNKKQNPDKLGLRKYCKWCKKHTVHKETKA